MQPPATKFPRGVRIAEKTRKKRAADDDMRSQRRRTRTSMSARKLESSAHRRNSRGAALDTPSPTPPLTPHTGPTKNRQPARANAHRRTGLQDGVAIAPGAPK